jgi:hypothetical protein
VEKKDDAPTVNESIKDREKQNDKDNNSEATSEENLIINEE